MAIKAGRVGVDPSQVTLSGYIKGGGVSPEVLTKEEARRIYQTIAGMAAYLTSADASSIYQRKSDMDDYQELLVAGQNIKRINGQSLLGSGNITLLTRQLADGIYQTIAGMSNYALKSEIPDMDDVVTKAEAPGYDDILTRTQAQLLYGLSAGTGIDITNGVVSNKFSNLTDGTDLNTVTYTFQGYIASGVNKPAGTSNSGVMFVASALTGSRVFQIYADVNSGTNYKNRVYTRIRDTANTWSDWAEVYTARSLAAGTGISISNGVVTNTALNSTLRYLNGNTYDLNEIMEEGIYECYNCLNIPSGSNGVLIVTKVSSSTYRQIFFRQGTIDTNDYYWYSRQISANTKGGWVLILNEKTGWLYPGSQLTVSTSSTSPIGMCGYIGSNGTALNLTIPLGRHISATSVTASTIRMNAYSSTGRLIAATAANDLITGNVYSCTLDLNSECDTIMLHIVKTDGTEFGTNTTAITGALSSATFTFS